MAFNRPSIFGVDSASEWFKKAQRELVRFENSQGEDDPTDHIINFAIAMAHVAEWHWYTSLKDHPRWKHLSGLNAFKAVIIKQQPALAHVETLCQSSKHPHLDRHEPSFEDATAMPVTVLRPISTHHLDPDDDPMPYMTLSDYQVRVEGKPVRLLQSARAVVTFWKSFDPNTSANN